jgi:hypothetical protein
MRKCSVQACYLHPTSSPRCPQAAIFGAPAKSSVLFSGSNGHREGYRDPGDIGGLGMRAGLGAGAAPAHEQDEEERLPEEDAGDASVVADVVKAQQTGSSWRERAAMLRQQRQAG